MQVMVPPITRPPPIPPGTERRPPPADNRSPALRAELHPGGPKTASSCGHDPVHPRRFAAMVRIGSTERMRLRNQRRAGSLSPVNTRAGSRASHRDRRSPLSSAGDAPPIATPIFYTLFVPARAHSFPMLRPAKPQGTLHRYLEVPAAGEVVANGPRSAGSGGATASGSALRRPRHCPPLSLPSLRSIPAETAERDGRRLRMFHQNRCGRWRAQPEAIRPRGGARLASNSTPIAYRFGKFDIVLIPSFQLSGMEHAEPSSTTLRCWRVGHTEPEARLARAPSR
jgi:hypothetical protein